MSHHIRPLPAARTDLLDIWLARAEYDEAAADRLLDMLDEALKLIAEYPEIGPERADLARGVRLFLRSPYLIAYQVDSAANAIDVIRVVDGRRNLSALLAAD